ncbi:MAG: DedA family protein, partial [Deltaproteobacteria bacterium]|nr:DedA family protein [Deltaproteobacteria bacterium]
PAVLLYVALGVSAFVENVFPPIPGDTITAFGAFLVGTHRLSFLWVYTATTLGSIIGFLFLFWVGTYLGRAFFLERDYRFFKARDILKAETWFQKYGYLLIVLNRFFPGIRSAIAVAGGISRLGFVRVAFLALISCSVWNLIWIWVGYSLGTNWASVREKMSSILIHYNITVAVLIGLVVGFLLLKRWLHARR